MSLTCWHPHNQGNIQATQFIATEAAEFAKSHGLALAGVQDAPSPTGVTSSGQQYMNDVNAQSGEVTNTAQSNSNSIQNKVSRSGLPADTDINSEALNVMYESDLQFLDVDKKIDQNESSMSTMGQWIEDNSRHKSDPQHSTVLADAVGNGITQVLPSQSQMEGIKESGKKLVNGFFD